MKYILNFLINVLVIALHKAYDFYKKNNEVCDKIVFLSRQSNDIPEDYQLLMEQINKVNIDLDKKLQIYISCRETTLSLGYFFHILKELRQLASARVVILDGYSFSVSNFNHKEELKVFQLWHSMGSFKKFGKQILEQKEGRKNYLSKTLKMHKGYDYVFASSNTYKNNLASGFGISPNKVYIYSLPRVDNILKIEENRTYLLNKYPILKNTRKNILYAPTFRVNNSDILTRITELSNAINWSQYNLIIQLHPVENEAVRRNLKQKLDNLGILCDIKEPTTKLLSVVDVIVSDYSCIIYEAAIIGVPIFLFTPDLEVYKKNRGFSIDFDETFKGYYFLTAKKLLENIDQLQNHTNYEKHRCFSKKLGQQYIENTTDTTEKIFQFIMSKSGIDFYRRKL